MSVEIGARHQPVDRSRAFIRRRVSKKLSRFDDRWNSPGQIKSHSTQECQIVNSDPARSDGRLVRQLINPSMQRVIGGGVRSRPQREPD
jgi:hypothetical protein